MQDLQEGACPADGASECQQIGRSVSVPTLQRLQPALPGTSLPTAGSSSLSSVPIWDGSVSGEGEIEQGRDEGRSGTEGAFAAGTAYWGGRER